MFKERCNDKARKKKINIEWLPPTTDAVQLHSERAYLQVQDWDGNSLNPESSGWHMVYDILEPIPIRQEPASRFLIKVKKCWYKSDYLDMF